MEPVVRVGVVVTFLRMDHCPPAPGPPLPAGTDVRQLDHCSVEQYRVLYDTVGADYVWWLRRTLPERELAGLLANPNVSIHVLYQDDTPAGFYELDRGTGGFASSAVNLSYFGLMPHAVGAGLGHAFLRHAVDTAWQGGTTSMSVNTCTADHPRALPTYQRVGFRIVRQVPEVWNVPTRLGLRIPETLLVP